MKNSFDSFDDVNEGRISKMLQFVHIDPVLFSGLLLLMAVGLGVLYLSLIHI